MGFSSDVGGLVFNKNEVTSIRGCIRAKKVVKISAAVHPI